MPVNISSAQLNHACRKTEDHAASVLKPTRQEVDQQWEVGGPKLLSEKNGDAIKRALNISYISK